MSEFCPFVDFLHDSKYRNDNTINVMEDAEKRDGGSVGRASWENHHIRRELAGIMFGENSLGLVLVSVAGCNGEILS